MAHLELISKENYGVVFPLASNPFLMGRESDCDIQELFLGDTTVSRHHACIRRDGGHYFLEDLNSTAGTYLNGEMVRGSRLLQDCDQIAIREFRFTFHHQRSQVDLTDLEGVDLEGDSSGSKAEFVDDLTDDKPITSIDSAIDASSSSGYIIQADMRLNALLDMLGKLGPSLNLSVTLNNVLSALFKVFPQADGGFIGLREGDLEVVKPAAAGRRNQKDADSVRVSRLIIREVIRARQAILSSDTSNDPLLSGSESVHDMKIRSVMCVPLLDVAAGPRGQPAGGPRGQPAGGPRSQEEKVVGVIQLDTVSRRSQFERKDLEVLVQVAPLVGLAIRLSRLHKQAVLRQTIEYDLRLAAKVQKNLLPENPPTFPGFEFHHFYRAALNVGGDYFEYFPLAPHTPPAGGGLESGALQDRLAVVLADVAGKGNSAALMAARLVGELQCLLRSEASPVEAFHQLNRDLCDGREVHLVTMIMAVIDSQSDQVMLLNGGHPPPILKRADGSADYLHDAARGMALGVERKETYPPATLTLAPGESLTMFTDGFMDAQNAQGEPFGEQRLHLQVQQAAGSAKQIGQTVLGGVEQFMGEQGRVDDMCLLCVRRKTDK